MTRRGARLPGSDDPFAVLGLPREKGLSDDDVRAAWRRIAAATHPDRDDGGDQARFGAAAAGYATLRTTYGRGEALADLGGGLPVRGRHRVRGARAGRGRRGVQGSRGRLGRLVLRAAAAGAASGVAVGVAGWGPASIGVLAGALTWLTATGRHDLPPWVRD